MALKIRSTDGNAQLDALTVCDTLNVYGSIYTILPPPHCADDLVGDLMLSFDLTATNWGVSGDQATGGRLSIGGLPITATALLTGGPAYFRMFAGGVCKFQGTAGPQGFGADMQFPTRYVLKGAIFPLSELLLIAVNNDA